MNNPPKLTLPELIIPSTRNYKDTVALSFVNGEPITYGELYKRIEKIISLLERLEISKGDKVAVYGMNGPHWGIAYLAITFMGAVAVPILPDFHEEEVVNIVNHSDSKVVFISGNLYEKTSLKECNRLTHVIKIDDFSLLDGKDVGNGPGSAGQDEGGGGVDEEDLAAIIYTSGTTGKSKGVMLTHKNLCSNVLDCGRVQYVDENDRILSILPLSHTFENTVGFLFPLSRGTGIFYLDKLPTAPVLLPALREIKPTIMLSVPLIIDKIFRKRILPALTDTRIKRTLYGIPFIRKKLHRIAGKKLHQMFGGELKFFGIGGAKLDKQVEQFLMEGKFPYAIGYGLTETSPLLAGVNPGTVRLESTGPAVPSVELKIHDPDPVKGEGEIWARGPSVMKGYYKNPELTAEVLTDEGWFKTGDLGIMDEDNYLFVKGRLKSMIVGLSGENIYPEEIEAVINNFRFVSESLIIDRKGKIVALVHFNKEELEEKARHLKDEMSQYVEDKIEDLKEELKMYVNSKVNKFSQVKLVIAQHEPFKKTATQKIKRFLYT